VARITVSPERVEDPAAVIRSGYSVELEARAFDASGALLEVPLTWSLRYPDAGNDLSAGAGHTLTVRDNNHARFTASGLAAGVFTVLVQDRSCNMAEEDRPQYPEGQAWITVQNDPHADAVCGRMRVTYGDQIDKMGDEVIAAAKVTLMAELSAKHKLSRDYRVKFFINEKQYPGLRPVYKEPTSPVAPGMELGYVALLPTYLVPGEFQVRYELLHQGEPVCGSRVERFRAR
jgi:hypothetical protein